MAKSKKNDFKKAQKAVEKHLSAFADWVVRQRAINRLCYVERPGVPSPIALPDGHMTLEFTKTERPIRKLRRKAREARRTAAAFQVIAWGRFTDILAFAASVRFRNVKREIAVACFACYLQGIGLTYLAREFGSLLDRDGATRERLDRRNELADRFLEKM